MTRLIDADAIEYHTMAKEDWLGNTVEDSKMVWKADIDSIPTVDAVPVEWILEYKEQFAQVSSDECDVGKAETLVDLLADWAEREEE